MEDESFGDLEYLDEDDEEMQVFNNDVNIRFVEKRTIELVQHQLASRINHEKTLKTAKLLNDDSSVYLPETKFKIRRCTSRLRKYGLKYDILILCKRCDEIMKKGSNCPRCRLSAKKQAKTNDYLIYIYLEPQLKQVLNEQFHEILDFIGREKKHDVISDTDDGNLYKNIQKKNSYKYVLSLTLNIDGGNLYKSAKHSLWPIQLYQNFLPPSIRFRPENIIIAGLFYGKNKPDVYNLLYPLAKELSEISITIHDSESNEFYEFSPSITIASCDLPAKQLLQNFVALSGRESCSYCYDPGESVRNSKGTSNIRYTFRDQFTERTHKETILIASSIPHNGKPKKGIKGRSVMELFDNFDVINSFAIDYMHGLSGIVKHIMEIWLGKKQLPTPPFGSYKIKTMDQRKRLNRRILLLKPYSAITRKPRSIFDTSLFKAKEFLMFLWFYLPITIHGILDKKIIENFNKLSTASYNLCKKTLSIDEINESCLLLDDFVEEFENIYGKGAITNNIHLLRHLKNVTINCGPLWSSCLFGCESNMGNIKNFVCGPTDSMHQIAEKYLNWKSFPEKKIEVNDDWKLCQPKILKLNEEQKIILSEFRTNSTNEPNFNIFRVLILHKTNYTCLETAPKKSVDYFVRMDDGTMGKIVFFLNI